MWSVLVIAVVIAVFYLIYLYARRNEGLDSNYPVTVAQEPQYWDGTSMLPCSKCTNSKDCPTCPQFALFTRPQMSIEGFEVPTPRYPIMPSPNDAWAAALQAKDSVINYDTFDEDSASLAQPLTYDLDPDYLSSREKMGACNTLSRSSRARAPFPGNVDASVLGTRNDDIFDGDRAVLPGRQMCRTSSSPVNRLLYGKTMGLTINARPTVDCEIMSYNGYSYKQRCDSSW